MAEGGRPTEEERLLAELRHAVSESREPVREIEVGVALSIALGRQRPSVSCGGCSTPLQFEGIPARTNPHMKAPFRLVPSTAARGE
jgi:hypothetical protein